MHTKTWLSVLLLIVTFNMWNSGNLSAATNEISVSPDSMSIEEGAVEAIRINDPRPARRFWDLFKVNRIEFTLDKDVAGRLDFLGAKKKNKKNVYKYSYIKLFPVIFMRAIDDQVDLGSFNVVFTLTKMKGGKINAQESQCAIDLIDNDNDDPDQNVAPRITSTAPVAATEDQVYNYQVEVLDPDDANNGTDLIWSLSLAPVNMDISSTGEITWTPVEGELSSGEVTVKVEDGGEDGAVPAEQTFEIIVTPVNDAPQITSTAPTTANQNVQYSYQVQVSDPDDANNGSDILFELQNAPQGMVISAQGLVQWTPSNGGSFGPITLIVRDGEEDNASPAQQIFTITVAAQNTAPIAVNDNWTLDEGASLSKNVISNDNDPEGNPVTAILVSPPQQNPAMQLAAGGSFTYTHNGSETVTDSFTYRINDGSLNSNIAKVSLTINPVNDAPVISGVPANTIFAGETYVFVPSASDADSDQLTFSIQNVPSWASFNSATGELSGTPGPADVQLYESIIISVSDGEKSIALPTFSIEVKPIASPSVEFADASISVNEGGAVARVHVELSNVWTEDVTVQLSTNSLNVTGKRGATPDEDYYEVQQGTVTIPAGKARVEQIIFIEQDELDEPEEIFGLNLINPQGADLGAQTQAQITIVDDDEHPVLEISPLSFVESQSGADIKLSLSAASEQVIALNYQTAGGSATAGSDYTAISQTGITFNPGEIEKTVSVTLLPDTVIEGDEDFELQLSGATNLNLAQSTYAIEIIDDEFHPDVVTLTTNPGNATITEGTAAPLEILLSVKDVVAGDNTVAREDLTFSLSFGLSDVPEAGKDYLLSQQTVTILKGGKTAVIKMHILNDNVYEGLETTTATVELVSGNATLENTTSVISITDDETAPQISINDSTIVESRLQGTAYAANQATLTVTLDKISAFDTTIDYATANGTAIAGSDYTQSNGQITIPAGSTTHDIVIPLINSDGDGEADEVFYVNLSNPNSGAQLADAQSAITIKDYDGNANVAVLSFDPNNPLATTLTVTEPSEGYIDVPLYASIPVGQSPDIVLSQLNIDAASTVTGGVDIEFSKHEFTIDSTHVDGMTPESPPIPLIDTYNFSNFTFVAAPDSFYTKDVQTSNYVVHVGTIRVYQDEIDETGSTEVLNLSLSQLDIIKPSAGFGADLLAGNNPQVVLNIVDNHTEKIPSLHITAVQPVVYENSGDDIAFRCTLIDLNTGKPIIVSSPVTIDYTLSGLASAGTDYAGTNAGSVNIPIGKHSTTISRSLLQDAEFESDEAVIVDALIQGGSSASSTVTIKDKIAPHFVMSTTRNHFVEGEAVIVKLLLVDGEGELLLISEYYNLQVNLSGEGIDDNDTSLSLDQVEYIQFQNGIGYLPITLLPDAGLTGTPEQTNGVETLELSIFNGVDVEQNLSFKIYEAPEVSLTSASGNLNLAEGQTISCQLDLDIPAPVSFSVAVKRSYTSQANMSSPTEIADITDIMFQPQNAKSSSYASSYGDIDLYWDDFILVHFEKGQQSQGIDFTGLLDEEAESNESLTIQIHERGNYEPFQPYTISTTENQLSGVITDASFDPEVRFTESSSNVREDTSVPIEISLDKAVNQKVTVLVDMNPKTGDTAVAADYLPESINTVIIDAGKTSGTLSFTANTDELPESLETVTISIQSATIHDYVNDVSTPVTVSAAQGSHQVSILESASLSFTAQQASSISLAEGQSANLEIRVQGDPNVAYEAAYEVIRLDTGVLADSDFAVAEGVVAIPAQPGGSSDRTFNVSVTATDDAIGEADESFLVRLKERNGFALGAYQELNISIPENDSPPTLSFVNSSVDVIEGDSTVIRLELSQAVTYDVALELAVAESFLASDGDDYSFESTALDIPVGQTYVDVFVSTSDNSITKGDAWIDIKIASAENALYQTDDEFRLTIKENDVGNVEFWVRPAGTTEDYTRAESNAFFAPVDLIFKTPENSNLDIYYLTNSDPQAGFGEASVIKNTSGGWEVYFGAQIAVKWDGNPILINAQQSIIALPVRDDGSNSNFIVRGQSNAGQYWIDTDGNEVEPDKPGQRISPYRWLIEQPTKDTTFHVKTNIGDGTAVPLGNRHVLVQANLDTADTTTIKLIATDVIGGIKERETNVNWAPSVIGVDGDIVVAVGDSLLLQAGNEGDGNVRIFPYEDPDLDGFLVQAGQAIPMTYNKAGRYRVSANDANGGEIGSFMVAVLGNPFGDERIIAEVDFEREVKVPDVRITYTALEADKLIVENPDQVGPGYDGASTNGKITIEPKAIDGLYLLARVGADGPIIGYKEVEEFIIDFDPWVTVPTLLQAKKHPAAIKVRPFIPGLSIISENRVLKYTEKQDEEEIEQIELLDDIAWSLHADLNLEQIGGDNEYDNMGVALDYGLMDVRHDSTALTQKFYAEFAGETVSKDYTDKNPTFATLIFELVNSTEDIKPLPDQGEYPTQFEVDYAKMDTLTYDVKVFTKPSGAWSKFMTGRELYVQGVFDSIELTDNGFYLHSDLEVEEGGSLFTIEEDEILKDVNHEIVFNVLKGLHVPIEYYEQSEGFTPYVLEFEAETISVEIEGELYDIAGIDTGEQEPPYFDEGTGYWVGSSAYWLEQKGEWNEDNISDDPTKYMFAHIGAYPATYFYERYSVETIVEHIGVYEAYQYYYYLNGERVDFNPVYGKPYHLPMGVTSYDREELPVEEYIWVHSYDEEDSNYLQNGIGDTLHTNIYITGEDTLRSEPDKPWYNAWGEPKFVWLHQDGHTPSGVKNIGDELPPKKIKTTIKRSSGIMDVALSYKKLLSGGTTEDANEEWEGDPSQLEKELDMAITAVWAGAPGNETSIGTRYVNQSEFQPVLVDDLLTSTGSSVKYTKFGMEHFDVQYTGINDQTQEGFASKQTVIFGQFSNELGLDWLPSMTYSIADINASFKPNRGSGIIGYGNMVIQVPVKVFRTPRMGPDLALYYNSRSCMDYGRGYGWSTNYDMRLFTPDQFKGEHISGIPTDFSLLDETGKLRAKSTFEAFYSNVEEVEDDNTNLSDSEKTPIVWPEGASYLILLGDGNRYYFDLEGYLVRLENMRGEAIKISYAPYKSHYKTIQTISDDYGRTIDLTATTVWEYNESTRDLTIHSDLEGLLVMSHNAIGDLTGIDRNTETYSISYSDRAYNEGVVEKVSLPGEGGPFEVKLNSDGTIDDKSMLIDVESARYIPYTPGSEREIYIMHDENGARYSIEFKDIILSAEETGGNEIPGKLVISRDPMNTSVERMDNLGRVYLSKQYRGVYDHEGDGTDAYDKEKKLEWQVITRSQFAYRDLANANKKLIKALVPQSISVHNTPNKFVEGDEGTTLTTSYEYYTDGKRAGAPRKVTYPDKTTVEYIYDHHGDLFTIVNRRGFKTELLDHDTYGNVNSTSVETQTGYYVETFVYESDLDKKLGRMTAQYNNLTGEGAKTGVSEFHDVFIFVPEETYGPRSTTVYTIDTRGRITNQVTSETQGGGN